MSEMKLYKIKLTKPVKLGEYWKDPGLVVKVDKDAAADIVTNKAGEFTDPEEAIAEKDLKSKSQNSANPDSGNQERDSIISALCNIDGVSTEIAENLVDAGYDSIESIAEADEDELIEIKGIGKKSVERIIESATEIVED